MLGLFSKKKKTKEEEEFIIPMIYFAALLQSKVTFLDDKVNDELIEATIIANRKKDPEDANQTYSDIYFNILTGNLFEKTISDEIELGFSLYCYKQVRQFISSAPAYNTDFLEDLMEGWRIILIHKGIEPENFMFDL